MNIIPWIKSRPIDQKSMIYGFIIGLIIGLLFNIIFLRLIYTCENLSCLLSFGLFIIPSAMISSIIHDSFTMPAECIQFHTNCNILYYIALENLLVFIIASVIISGIIGIILKKIK